MRYAFIAPAIALFAFAAQAGQTGKEVAEYRGKSFQEWQREIHSKDPSRREVAIKAILVFGPDKAYEAVPNILAELKKHSANTPVDLTVRVSGTMALSTIFKQKKQPDPRHIQDALTVFRTFLKDPQLLMRVRAVQALTSLGPQSREALPDVLKMAREPTTWEARREAVAVLAVLGFDEKGVPSVPVMTEAIRALDDISSQVRIAGLHAIVQLGSAADESQRNPILGRLNGMFLKETDEQVILHLHLSVMLLQRKVTKAHLDRIANRLKSSDPQLRMEAVRVIGMTGTEGKAAAPALVGVISDPEVSIAVSAISSLVQMEAVEAVPVLRSTANDTNTPEIVRGAAKEALAFFEYREKSKK